MCAVVSKLILCINKSQPLESVSSRMPPLTYKRDMILGEWRVGKKALSN